MSAKVVLPDFHLPGQGPHIAIRALWATGGLVVVATVILGAALWHRTSVDTASQIAAARAIIAATQQPAIAARAPALADAPAAPVAPATLAAVAAGSAAEQPSAAPASIPATRPLAGHPAHHRAAGAHHASRSMKARALARSSATDRRSKKPVEKKDDAVDRLLRQFK